jgi:hypothetical protein
LRLVSSSEAKETTLTAVLNAEDLAVELGLDPCARVTCRHHRCWSHQCVGRPGHVRPRTSAAVRQVELACRTSIAASHAQ